MILRPFPQSVCDPRHRADANKGVMNSPFKISSGKDAIKETFLLSFVNRCNGYIKIAQWVKEVINAAKTHHMDNEVS